MTLNWSIPSNTSEDLQSYYCKEAHVSSSATAFLVTRAVLVVPFAIWILYLGCQRWRQQKCSVKLMSHCDIITYHMVLMQLTEAPGLVVFLIGYIVPSLSAVGFSILSLTIVGEILFHVLTCVERYLAVIHPVTYLKLKNTSGVLMRNMCVGGVWLFALAWGALVIFLSVLRVLVRPRPGGVGGDRGDQSKKKAFKTILTITGALWLLFTGYFVCFVLKVSTSLSYSDWCLVATCIVCLVALHVRLQAVALREGLVTQGTLVRSLSVVRPHVDGQRGGQFEAALTDLASVGSFSGVRHLVAGQGSVAAQKFAADPTEVRFTFTSQRLKSPLPIQGQDVKRFMVSSQLRDSRPQQVQKVQPLQASRTLQRDQRTFFHHWKQRKTDRHIKFTE
ncbi:hypothetical protein GOODEAATRI_011327 [Goodea atripinnis]|uniref:G-protein coupled receptors family 1 profile domain-containing protein n=1 Tax=Goodea atripinnis TaxID=208336 RepID=A0ABV0MSL8_9TELE